MIAANLTQQVNNNNWSQIQKMSIHQKLKCQLKSFLSSKTSEPQIKSYISTLLHKQSAQFAFHQLDLQSLKQPTLVYVKMMVQDMRDPCYIYPVCIEKPFSEQSQVYIFKYGQTQQDFTAQKLENQKFFSYFQDRQTISCYPILYQTQWIKDIQKNLLKEQTYQMMTYQLNLFKLGEVFKAICVYDPTSKTLHYVRKANQQEIKKWQYLAEYLSKEINALQTKQNFIKILTSTYSERYSNFLIYTMLSSEFLFISATQSNVQLFKKILPRVCEIKIKAPFKQSLFPYKNQQQQLIRTKMQMSNQHNLVIIDFSQFSSDSSIKIQQQQIDNIKALKVFVQQGKTIYRWLYGQSQLSHNNTGLIVRASSILNPQYIIPQQTKQIKSIQFSSVELHQIRCYIQKARRCQPILKGDREQIQNIIHGEKISFNQLSLTKVMELAKLNAKSRHDQEIKVQDFQQACKMFF